MRSVHFIVHVLIVAATIGTTSAREFEGASQTTLSAGLGAGLDDRLAGSKPALRLSIEHRAFERASLGVFLEVSAERGTESLLGTRIEFQGRIVSIGARGSCHLGWRGSERLDPYVGVAIGYSWLRAQSPPTEYPAPEAGALLTGTHAGVRVQVTRWLGVFAEVGFTRRSIGDGVVTSSRSATSAGISFRF